MLPLSNQASHLRGDWHRHSSELLLNPIVMSELQQASGEIRQYPAGAMPDKAPFKKSSLLRGGPVVAYEYRPLASLL